MSQPDLEDGLHMEDATNAATLQADGRTVAEGLGKLPHLVEPLEWYVGTAAGAGEGEAELVPYPSSSLMTPDLVVPFGDLGQSTPRRPSPLVRRYGP